MSHTGGELQSKARFLGGERSDTEIIFKNKNDLEPKFRGGVANREEPHEGGWQVWSLSQENIMSEKGFQHSFTPEVSNLPNDLFFILIFLTHTLAQASTFLRFPNTST